MSRYPVLVLAVALLATPASAQFRVNPAVLGNQPVMTTGGFVRPVGVAVPNYSPVYNPYATGWGGYGYVDPAYGLLSGVADLTTATAQAQVTLGQARIVNQQNLRSQLDTRRAMIEQARWEEALKPTAETLRQDAWELSLRRSLNNPPLGDITSGESLNTLMEQVRRNTIAQVPGPMIPLDAETLRHVNVTTGTTANGSAVARDTESLKWPLPLQAPRWNGLREIVNVTMSNAALEARASGIQFETNKRLTQAIGDLDREVDDAIAEMTPTEYIQSRRFITQLKETRKTLADPSASSYLSGKLTAKGNNVSELVQHMQSSGLRFAPALPGDEAYYRSLQNSMAAYVGSQAMLTTQGTRPQGTRP